MRHIDQLQPLREVASRLGVTTRTVQRWSQTGELPHPVRIGRITYYPPYTVENFLDSKLAS